MASKTTVTMDNLAALGPERLAAILVELADGDAEATRPATAALDTAGTTRFTIPTANGPEAAAGMAGAASNATSAMHLIMPTLAGG